MSDQEPAAIPSMTPKGSRRELSLKYFRATEIISTAATELYEAIHSEGGAPVLNDLELMLAIKKFRTTINLELESIRSNAESLRMSGR